MGRDALAVITPEAGDVAEEKLPPPFVETSILITFPAIHTMYTVPSPETLISGEKESLAELLPVFCPDVPTQVAP